MNVCFVLDRISEKGKVLASIPGLRPRRITGYLAYMNDYLTYMIPAGDVGEDEVSVRNLVGLRARELTASLVGELLGPRLRSIVSDAKLASLAEKSPSEVRAYMVGRGEVPSWDAEVYFHWREYLLAFKLFFGVLEVYTRLPATRVCTVAEIMEGDSAEDKVFLLHNVVDFDLLLRNPVNVELLFGDVPPPVSVSFLLDTYIPAVRGGRVWTVPAPEPSLDGRYFHQQKESPTIWGDSCVPHGVRALAQRIRPDNFFWDTGRARMAAEDILIVPRGESGLFGRREGESVILEVGRSRVESSGGLRRFVVNFVEVHRMSVRDVLRTLGGLGIFRDGPLSDCVVSFYAPPRCPPSAPGSMISLVRAVLLHSIPLEPPPPDRRILPSPVPMSKATKFLGIEAETLALERYPPIFLRNRPLALHLNRFANEARLGEPLRHGETVLWDRELWRVGRPRSNEVTLISMASRKRGSNGRRKIDVPAQGRGSPVPVKFLTFDLVSEALELGEEGAIVFVDDADSIDADLPRILRALPSHAPCYVGGIAEVHVGNVRKLVYQM